MEAHDGKAVDRDRHPARFALNEAEEVVAAARADLQARVDAHPYLVLAAGVGVGYVLGGGLFTSFTGRVLRWGMRHWFRLGVVPLLEAELVGTAREWAAGSPANGSAAH
jgi:hypothetical protein